MSSSISNPKYELIYWSGAPGRGEHIRLLLEEAGAEYSDLEHKESFEAAFHYSRPIVGQYLTDDYLGDKNNLPAFAPPLLRHGDLFISQTPNILMYLGKQLGLNGPGKPGDEYRVNALALTALDGLSNEAHDCHHPICTWLSYEDQKTEAIRRAGEYLKWRLPKFLGHFEKCLKSEASGDGPWLYGGVLTYADLVLTHCIDGLVWQFPKAMDLARKSGKYAGIFKLHDAVRERPRIAAYLASDRRWGFISMGVYRNYPEFDITPDEFVKALSSSEDIAKGEIESMKDLGSKAAE